MRLKAISFTDFDAIQKILATWLDAGSGSKNTGYIASCVDVWGLFFAKVKFRLYDKADDNVEIESHPAVRIFQKPNWFQTWWEIKYRIASDFSFWGNSYLLKLRDGINTVSGLIQLHPDRLKTYPYNKEIIEYYEYQTGDRILKIDPAEMIHLRYPDPDNYIKGLPVIEKIIDLREIERMQISYRKKSYKQGGFLGAVFSTEQKMGDVNFKRAEKELMEKFGGEDNAFRIGLFEQGLKPIPTAYSMKDLQMKEERELNRDEILAAWKVNKLLLGQSELVQRGNADTVFYIFASMVIDPLMDYIDECLTSQWIAVDYEADDYVKHDQVATRDTDSLLRYYKTLLDGGVISPNTVAEEEGYPTYDLDYMNVPKDTSKSSSANLIS